MKLARILVSAFLVAISAASMAQRVFDASKEFPQSGSTFMGHTFTSTNSDYRMLQQAVWRACEAGEGDVYIPNANSRNWVLPQTIVVDRADGVPPTGIRIIGQGPYPIVFTGTGSAFEFRSCRNCFIQDLGVDLSNSGQIGLKFTGDCTLTKVEGCKVRLIDGPTFRTDCIGFMTGEGSNTANMLFTGCSFRYQTSSLFVPGNDASSISIWSRKNIGFVFLGRNTTQISVENCFVSGAQLGFTNYDVSNEGTPGASSMNFVNCSCVNTGCCYLISPDLVDASDSLSISKGDNIYCGVLFVYGNTLSSKELLVSTVSVSSVKFKNAQNGLNSQITVLGKSICKDGNIMAFYNSGYLSLTGNSFHRGNLQGLAGMMFIKGSQGSGRPGAITVSSNVIVGYGDIWNLVGTWDTYIEGNTGQNTWRVTDLASNVSMIAH